MNPTSSHRVRRGFRLRLLPAGVVLLVFLSQPARASILHGETLDSVANVLSWIVLVIAPIVAIVVFLLIHILPEKIAEKRRHPQTKAIQCLCLLSLAFGGLLWPLAWLWAYSKPVFHKLAYGTDVEPHAEEPQPEVQPRAPAKEETEEVKQLRKRVAELETKLSSKTIVE
jgi:CBS domain containing-hemolysin-like protein